MCFSASASFTAGAILAVTGVVALRNVQTKSQLPFAFLPLIFAVQQISEGFLWLSLLDNNFVGWHTPMKYIFLSFAQVIWPFWIPFSFMLIEESPKRRKIIRYFVLGGIAVSLLLLYRLLNFSAVAHIDGCHIEYNIGATKIMLIASGILYLSAIVIAPFFSTWKYARLLASVNVVSLIVTELFFKVYFVSVWCFFAAIQSVIVVLIIREMKREHELKVKS